MVNWEHTKTYWLWFPRDFNNEYSVGVASGKDWATMYKSQGFERIPREKAIRKMRYRGDAITEAFVVVELDGKQVDDRWMYARELKGG